MGGWVDGKIKPFCDSVFYVCKGLQFGKLLLESIVTRYHDDRNAKVACNASIDE